MYKVKGEFDVTLRTPIAIDYEFQGKELQPLTFGVNDDQVQLFVLEQQEPTIFEGDVVEGSTILQIKLFVEKDVENLGGEPPGLWLPSEEHSKFELVVCEATRRFVTAVKKRTDEWNLDHRLPVRAYFPRYYYEDLPLEMRFPVHEGHLRVPKEAAGASLFSLSFFHGDLTEDMWNEIPSDMSCMVTIPHHHEMLFDAKAFVLSHRYETAILYSAFATETILQEMSRLLLRGQGSSKKQTDAILRNINNPGLIALVRVLESRELPQFGDKKLDALFTLRNDIVHRKLTSVSNTEALNAVDTVTKLIELLDSHSEP